MQSGRTDRLHGWRTTAITILAAACLTGCAADPSGWFMPGPAGGRTHSAAENGTATASAGQGAVGIDTAAAAASYAADKPFAGGTFDPQHLFDVHDDQIAVSEVDGAVYVTWESFANGDMVYTSVAQGGHWVAQDVPVYNLHTLAGDGDWSLYLSGNALMVVNRLQDTSFAVEWDEHGHVILQRSLYKGWVGGDFSVRSGDEFGVSLHLPYGAPAGGARYNLYIPGQLGQPTIVTVDASQFTGALYAFDARDHYLVEARHVKVGAPVMDLYQVNRSSSGDGGFAGQTTAANTLPVAGPGGTPLQTKFTVFPDALAVDASGHIYTMARVHSGIVQVDEYSPALHLIAQWERVPLANPRAQNVAFTIGAGQPHVWDVFADNGLAELEQIQLQPQGRQ
ncbi:MAG: hypothetical protein K6T78_13850 [Alicyclobacillus sp.]|nr:hypothetical protein [Alicyclobacillus sp.]